MSRVESAATIEAKVGVKRDPVQHWGRAATAEQRVYILHSYACLDSGMDLRECPFSVALDDGINLADWVGDEDRPIQLGIDPDGVLCPAGVAYYRATEGQE